MIENPPILQEADLFHAYRTLSKGENGEIASLVEKINEHYDYWSEVKYKIIPPSVTHKDLWTYVKASRMQNRMTIWPTYGISLSITNAMQRICHELDMRFAGVWGNQPVIPEENKQQYLLSSLMEEAISSSQMEGASTTRKVAKDMLRKKMTPRDSSQQMIYNNYQTIQFITENKDKPFSEEMLLRIHQLMTEGTLEQAEDAGRFRSNNHVVVENGITHEIVHTPPSYQEIPQFITHLRDFFNEEKPLVFIHPIIRGIIVHFMLAYVHPFVDGNGRTARALFYWYMLKQGYNLTEYLSISRIIARSKKSYEKAYLYVEADQHDLGYFVSYHLHVLEQAFNELQQYIKRKTDLQKQAAQFLRLGDINPRQAEIIRLFHDNPHEVITVKDMQAKFSITPTTAKSDISGLVKRGILEEIALNKVKRGYIKGAAFDKLTENRKGDIR